MSPIALFQNPCYDDQVIQHLRYTLNCITCLCRTMYCTKGNYEFGILRIMHSLQPYSRKLGPETWYYIKRCFLSLIECLAKHMIMIKDEILQSCLYFLEDCERTSRQNVSLTCYNTLRRFHLPVSSLVM